MWHDAKDDYPVTGDDLDIYGEDAFFRTGSYTYPSAKVRMKKIKYRMQKENGRSEGGAKMNIEKYRKHLKDRGELFLLSNGLGYCNWKDELELFNECFPSGVECEEDFPPISLKKMIVKGIDAAYEYLIEHGELDDLPIDAIPGLVRAIFYGVWTGRDVTGPDADVALEVLKEEGEV